MAAEEEAVAEPSLLQKLTKDRFFEEWLCPSCRYNHRKVFGCGIEENAFVVRCERCGETETIYAASAAEIAASPSIADLWRSKGALIPKRDAASALDRPLVLELRKCPVKTDKPWHWVLLTAGGKKLATSPFYEESPRKYCETLANKLGATYAEHFNW